MATNNKLPNNKNHKSDDNPIINFMLYLVVPFMISIPILLVLSNGYYHIQNKTFSDANTLLLIHDDKSLIVLIASPIIITLLFIIKIRNRATFSNWKNKMYTRSILIIFFIATVFLSFDFFCYTDIKNNGINVKNGLIYDIKHYTWNDVEHVRVLYDYGYKSNIDISYIIFFDDGNFIDAYDSNHFFDNIVKLDEFIQKKNIAIIRDEILSEDRAHFEMQFEGKGSTSVDRLYVMETIFAK